MYPKQETFAPNDFKFIATLPAPPGTNSILCSFITGTGASGDCLVEFPKHNYQS